MYLHFPCLDKVAFKILAHILFLKIVLKVRSAKQLQGIFLFFKVNMDCSFALSAKNYSGAPWHCHDALQGEATGVL